MFLLLPFSVAFSNGVETIYIPLCFYYYGFNKTTAQSYHQFTFHYVSITTSTDSADKISRLIFTFHYVSITTVYADSSNNVYLKFTFHYVSITTMMRA